MLPLEAPESPDTTSEAIDFSELDPYNGADPAPDDQGVEFDHQGEDDDSPPAETQPEQRPEATPETPPAEGAPSPESQDPIFEVPGYGQIRGSEITQLLASRNLYSNLQGEQTRLTQERQSLQTERERLDEAIRLSEVLEYPGVRSKMREALSELFSPGADFDGQRDGNRGEFFQGLPPQLQRSTPAEPARDPRVDELMQRETDREINDVLAELHQANPELLTQQFADEIIDTALGLYASDPDKLGAREFRFIANDMVSKRLLASRSKDAEIVQAIQKLEPGARVVTGGSHRSAVTEPKPKDPRKMEYSELEAELGQVMYDGEDL